MVIRPLITRWSSDPLSPDGDQTSFHQVYDQTSYHHLLRPFRPLTTSTVSGFCHLFLPRSSASTIFRPSHSFTSNSPIYRQPPLDRPVYLTISDSQVAPLDQFWLLEQSTYSYSCLNSCSYSPFTPHTCNISPASPSLIFLKPRVILQGSFPPCPCFCSSCL